MPGYGIHSALFALVLIVGADGTATHPGDAPPSTAALDYDRYQANLFADGMEARELAKNMASRAAQLTEDECRPRASSLHSRVVESVKRSAKGRERLFAGENGGLRDEVLEILAKMASARPGVGAKLGAVDVEAMLPSPEQLEGYDLDSIRTVAFAAFAKARWGDGCTQRVLALVSQPIMEKDPAWFLAGLWLGHKAVPSPHRDGLTKALEATPLGQPKGLDESQIARLFRVLQDKAWEDAEVSGVRDQIRGRLASHLYGLEELKEGEAESALLTSDEFLLLASTRPPWTKWTEKLARQLKDKKTRNPRVRGLLGDCIGRDGDHFKVLEELVRLDADVDLFTYLHATSGKPSAPWLLLNAQNEKYPARSVGLLKYLFAVENCNKWTTDLLDVLLSPYFSSQIEMPSSGKTAKTAKEDLLEGVLRPIVRDAQVLDTHPVRCELLARVNDGRFIPWRDCWLLAQDAAGARPLKATLRLAVKDPSSQDASTKAETNGKSNPVSSPKGQTTAVEFLCSTCCNLPLDDKNPTAALEQVNATFLKLLDHLHHRLFEVKSPDATLDDKAVVEPLTAFFGRLAELRVKFGWRSKDFRTSEFWEHAQASFRKAATAKDRARMSDVLRLMLRICGVFGEAEPVRSLAKASAEVFGITKPRPFRVLRDEDLAEQVGFFREVGPAIHDAIAAVRADRQAEGSSDPRLLTEIVDEFQKRLYSPLLRTNQFLEKTGASPWLQLIECYPTEAGRKAGLVALVRELGDRQLQFLNAEEQVGQIAERWQREIGVRPWVDPAQVPLSENISIAIFKRLLDKTNQDLQLDAARPTLVAAVLVTSLKSENRHLWIKACHYPTPDERSDVTYSDPGKLLTYVSNLVAFCEARDAPFHRGGVEFDVSELHQYADETGPSYELGQGSWQRRPVDGELRMALYRAWAELRRGKAGTAEGLPRRLEHTAIALMLPNHAENATDPQRLPEYERCKKETIADLEQMLDGAQSDEEVFQVLQALVRFDFSFRIRHKNEAISAAIARGKQRLDPGAVPLDPLQVARRKRLLRALLYEEMFLALANAGPNRRTSDWTRRLEYLLQAYREERGLPDDPDDFVRALTFGRVAAHAGENIQYVGPADVIAMYPLMEALAEEPQGHDLATAVKVFWVYCRILPFFGLNPDVLLEPTPAGDDRQRRDRLILFSLLSTAKTNLTRWATFAEGDRPQQLSRASQAQLGQLLIDHNNLAMMLVSKVFEDRDLLLLTQKDIEYTAETIDFAILYHRRTRFPLSARDLLNGAFEGCRSNFKMAQHMGRAAGTDLAVFEFLFFGRPPVARSLDDVIRANARMATDPRYRDDPNAEVRKAAEAFQNGAKQFMESPEVSSVTSGEDARQRDRSPLAWFRDQETIALLEAPSYLRMCELAGERILDEAPWSQWRRKPGSDPWELPGKQTDERRQQAAAWKHDASKEHARLWRHWLLGTKAGRDNGNPVPWSDAFIRRFCSDKPHDPGTVGLSLADSLRRQRALLERLVRGDGSAGESGGPVDRAVRLKGLRHTLAEVRRLDSATPAGGYYRAYWEAAKVLFNAVQLGHGLDKDARYLSAPFLAVPAGRARAVTEDEMRRCLDPKDADSLFEPLDWPYRWDDQFPERELKSLLGEPLAAILGPVRERPGLGGMNADLDQSASSYRHAAWLAMSAYAAERLRPPIKHLDDTRQKLEATALESALPAARNRQEQVLRNVLRIIELYEEHNRGIEELLRRSQGAASSDRARVERAATWKWMEMDGLTVRWAKEGWTKEGRAKPPAESDLWLPLVALWAPFEEYSGRKGHPVPPALYLVPETWGRPEASAEARLRSFMHLLGMAAVRNGGKEWALTPSCEQSYAAITPGVPEANRKACLEAVLRWTDLARWSPLLDPAQQQDVAGLKDYSYLAVQPEPIRKVLSAGLGPLAAEALDLCHFSAPNAAAWKSHYQQKMRFVVACDIARAIAAKDHGGSMGALDALYHLACRTEPCASPFQVEVLPTTDPGTGSQIERIRLMTSAETLSPDAIGRIADPDAQSALLARLKTWCLVQREGTPDGRLVTKPAGYMGFVDLVQRPAPLTESKLGRVDSETPGSGRK